jgi:hypothetical protein
VELAFSLRNVGGSSCHTYGYPGVALLDSAGRPLPTPSVRTTHDIVGSAPAVPLTLAPGAKASFRIVVAHNGNVCSAAYGLQVIPPDDTHTLRTSVSEYACGSMTVTPLRPGTSALA